MITSCPAGDHEPCAATDHVKYGQSELSCAVSVQYTLHLGDLVLKRMQKYPINNIYIDYMYLNTILTYWG